MNIYPASYGSPLVSIASVREQLQSIFGSQFTIWAYDENGWKCNPDNSVLPANSDMYQLSTEIQAWLEQVVLKNASSPRVGTFHEATYVAVAIKDELASEVVLLGRVELSLCDLAKRAAENALNQAQKVVEIADRDDLHLHYAARLSESFEELTFLRQLSRHVDCCVADRSLIDAAEAILPQLLELMSLEGVCLLAPSPAGSAARSAARSAVGSDGLMGHAGIMPDVNSLRNYVDGLGTQNQHVIVRNFDGEFDHISANKPVGVRSLAIAPIEKDESLYGWLVGINKLSSDSCRAEIGSMEASLLEAAALMLGAQAANNRLFQEKENLVVDVIHTLVGVIEAKDVYTCGHSDRVALIGRRIAEELGLSAAECQEIFLSGLLHDIGKIGVSDDVLLKPGKLSAEEFDLIKTHPLRGGRLLKSLRPLIKLIPGVLHHHEAVDGSGYPLGLKGDDIPLMARILAVADAFDAMTSDRPYRTGMALEKAESILRSGVGKHWDARVVEAYFAARDDIVKIGSQWQDHLHRLLNLAPSESALTIMDTFVTKDCPTVVSAVVAQ